MTGAMLIAAGLCGPAAAADLSGAGGDWVHIRGTVAAATPSGFELRHDEGSILVEVDDWDRRGEANGLLRGDEVVVYGRLDRNLFDPRSIEASSVYVQSFGVHYAASAMDEEAVFAWRLKDVEGMNRVTLRGDVRGVSVDQQQIAVQTEDDDLVTIDMAELPYDMLDEVGAQQIRIGDPVYVRGSFHSGPRRERIFVADVVSNEPIKAPESRPAR